MQFFFQSNILQQVKRFVIENEEVDSDFWDCGGNDLLQGLLVEMKDSDWKNLASSIKSWTSRQKAILADALIKPDTHFENVDTAALYGYIFTIVENSEADYLIQELDVLYNSTTLTDSLLKAIKQRILELKEYTDPIHNVHDYDRYLLIVKRLSNALISKK